MCGIICFPNNVWRCEEKKDRKGKYAKTLTTQTWYLGRVYKIHYKSGNKWIEYWQLIDLHNQPFNMDIRLCWFQTQEESLPLISMHTHTLKTYLSRGYLPCKKDYKVWYFKNKGKWLCFNTPFY